MSIRSYQGKTPALADNAFVDAFACVSGDVSLGEGASVWPFASIRGDLMPIKIGARSNVQDNATLHTTHDGKFNPGGSQLTIGEDVTIGHGAVCHGCTIHDRVLIGMNAVVLDNAVIESDVMIGAGSLVPPGKTLQSGYLYVGSPAKRARLLTEEEKTFLRYSADFYVQLAEKHKVEK